MLADAGPSWFGSRCLFLLDNCPNINHIMSLPDICSTGVSIRPSGERGDNLTDQDAKALHYEKGVFSFVQYLVRPGHSQTIICIIISKHLYTTAIIIYLFSLIVPPLQAFTLTAKSSEAAALFNANLKVPSAFKYNIYGNITDWGVAKK